VNALDIAYCGAGLVASPWLIYKAATDPRYRDRLEERMGELPPGPPGVWFHAASVGEVALARAVAKRVAPARITTLTRAGRELAAKHFPRASYFPLDLTPFVRRSLRIAKPTAVVLVELEVWPNFLRELRCPAVVVNGRMTERSLRRYRKLELFRAVFAKLTVGARDAESAERFRALGARVEVTGNLKYDSGLAYDPAVERRWRERLGWTGPVIVAGSTHDPEEKLILDAFRELRKSIPELRLAIAPRHVERAGEIPREDGVFVLDTVGQLAELYSIATVVFIGGTFCARGGQNMLEPAALGKPVVGGPSLANFVEISGALVEAGGMRVVPEPSGLAAALREVLRDPRPMGERARSVAERGRGALDRTAGLLLRAGAR
jgi:3-deoxy-D-manno-octulosonic-acid transferase